MLVSKIMKYYINNPNRVFLQARHITGAAWSVSLARTPVRKSARRLRSPCQYCSKTSMSFSDVTVMPPTLFNPPSKQVETLVDQKDQVIDQFGQNGYTATFSDFHLVIFRKSLYIFVHLFTSVKIFIHVLRPFYFSHIFTS